MKRVLIVGAGLAGLSAALELAEREYDVTVLEASTAGGKLKGWRDNDGDTLETGMHFWWGHYRNFYDLLKRLELEGVFNSIEPAFALVRSGGKRTRISGRVSGVLGPIRMILGLEQLSIGEKLQGFWGMAKLLTAAAEANPHDLDSVSFRTWAHEYGVGGRLLTEFLEPLVTANFYLPASEVSAAAVLTACSSYLSKSATPLHCLRGNASEWLIDPMVTRLKRLGIKILERHRVNGILTDNQRILGLKVSRPDGSEGEWTSDHYISAVNITALQELTLFDPSLRDFNAALQQLDEVPLVTARIWWTEGTSLDDLVCGHFANVPLLRTFFILSRLQEEYQRQEQSVWEVQTGPVGKYLHLEDDQLWQHVLRDLHAAFPELRHIGVRKWRLQRLLSGFTSYRVGMARSRPTVSTPFANLHLAGEWLQTDYPVFGMEKAVVTGRLAANAVVAATGGKAIPIMTTPIQFGLFPFKRRVTYPVPEAVDEVAVASGSADKRGR